MRAPPWAAAAPAGRHASPWRDSRPEPSWTTIPGHRDDAPAPGPRKPGIVRQEPSCRTHGRRWPPRPSQPFSGPIRLPPRPLPVSCRPDARFGPRIRAPPPPARRRVDSVVRKRPRGPWRRIVRAGLPSPRTELPCDVAAASPDARLTTRPDARFRPSRRLGARHDLAPTRSSVPESSAKGPIRASGTLLPRIVPGVIHDFAVAAARHPSPPGRAPHRPSWPFCGLCGPVPSQLWKSLWMPVDDVLRPQGTHCEELQGSCGRSTARPRAVPAIPRFRPQESHIRIPVISSADDRIPQNPRALIRLRAPL